MKLYSKLNQGFTLVELLSSMIVLIAVGSIIAGIVISSIVGTNKTNTIENIRQNGNYTLNQISRNIEYAQVFNGASETGAAYDANCYYAAPTPAPLVKYIKITALSGNSIVYNCDGSTLTTYTLDGITVPDPTPLFDTASLSLTSCSMSCTQDKATGTPLIRIGFNLGPINSNGGFVENSSPPIIFETAVVVRNHKK
jgi:type II secretory pathway pseudopilin PulG